MERCCVGLGCVTHPCLLFVRNLSPQTLRLLLRADPTQDPEAYGEISYLASRGKYRDRFEESKT
jgi:hypothetical protein